MKTRNSNATADKQSTGAADVPAAKDSAKDTQPAPSGSGGSPANQGSPAAPVMKQFSKTEAESNGRRETD